jgi:hypothetical protein
MKTGFLILILGIFGAIQLPGQCEGCQSVAGEVIDFCFIESEWPDRCVQFTEDHKYFYYQSPRVKNGQPIKFYFPEDDQAIGTEYFAGLATNHKKLKLGHHDILILEHGVEQWRQLEGLRKWDMKYVNSGYTVLPSGLAYKPLRAGAGKLPLKGNLVTVHYTGYLESGYKFGSSLDGKQSFQFILGNAEVIKGWEEGILTMQVGSRNLLRIPPHLGYGQAGAGAGEIPPNSTLYFDIQLLAAE